MDVCCVMGCCQCVLVPPTYVSLQASLLSSKKLKSLRRKRYSGDGKMEGVCVCVCVCACVCVCVCVCTCVCVCVCVCTCVRVLRGYIILCHCNALYICTYVYMYVCMLMQ